MGFSIPGGGSVSLPSTSSISLPSGVGMSTPSLNLSSIFGDIIGGVTDSIHSLFGNIAGGGQISTVKPPEEPFEHSPDSLFTKFNEMMKDEAVQNLFINPQHGYGVNRFGGLADRYDEISRGDDPRFNAYRDAQMALMDQQQQEQIAQTGDFFNRRGLGDSTARLNAEARARQGFDAQRQALSGQLGMQQLARQDQALGSIGNILGLRNQAYDQRLQGLSSGLQNLLIPEQLRIAEIAAKNAGKYPEPQKGGGLLSGILNILN